jgi:hypothetical protein
MSDESSWQFDALDPRGGIAFASWRSFSLTDEENGLREAPCVRIGAPFFFPESVATRALARAANRGSFQLGLFIEGQEVRFATLDAVIEFVRRVYLRSGGGDGLDGGAAPVPPRPVGGGPELPPLPEEPELPRGPESEPEEEPRDGPPGHGPVSGSIAVRPAPDALELIGSFRRMTLSLGQLVVAGQPFSWFNEPAATRDSGSDGAAYLPAPTIGPLRRSMDALGWAALLLIQEMLLRLPAARLLAEQRRWERAAHGLGRTIARLDLWNWLFGRVGSRILQSWADAMQDSAGWPIEPQLARIRSIPDLSDFARVRIVYWLLFGGAPTIDNEDWLYWMREHWRFFGRPYRVIPSFPFFGNAVSSMDPFEELRLIPLPRSVARIVSSHDREEISLRHLLAAATASPAKLMEDGRGGRDAMALLLFAACGLISVDGEAQPSFGSFGQWSTSISRLQNQRIEDLTAHAWVWLARSLPRLAFPEPLEAAIGGASMLRYAREQMP